MPKALPIALRNVGCSDVVHEQHLGDAKRLDVRRGRVGTHYRGVRARRRARIPSDGDWQGERRRRARKRSGLPTSPLHYSRRADKLPHFKEALQERLTYTEIDVVDMATFAPTDDKDASHHLVLKGPGRLLIAYGGTTSLADVFVIGLPGIIVAI